MSMSNARFGAVWPVPGRTETRAELAGPAVAIGDGL